MKDFGFVSFNIPRVTGVRRPGEQDPEIIFSFIFLIESEEDEARDVTLSLS